MADNDFDDDEIGYPNFSKRYRFQNAERRLLIDEKFVEIHTQLNDMELRMMKKMQLILDEVRKNASKRDK